MSVSFKNLRNLGYNYAESLAELVDNSIKAKAKNVEIYFYYTDDPFILTIDDGHGMDKNEIENKALVAPKGDNVYVDSGPNDLGRFGMGLKQGTFAQCKMLTVFSKKNTLVHKSINLNEEEEISDFLPQCVSHKFIKEKIKNLENSNSGTAILWSNLDKLLKERDENNLNFYPEIEKVKKHFKMIYHKRIINNKIKIFFSRKREKSSTKISRSILYPASRNY